MTFKDIIKTELAKKHWELIAIDTLGEWWEDEHWKIQWKHPQGLVLYIHFLIDLQNEAMIGDIEATLAMKDTRLALNDHESNIATLSMSKGEFNSKLSEFINNIEKYRTNETI
jgi:hypothetical protein